ncbi:MAG: hypothetical protein M3Y27_21200 [Acidobacteriota bacterium]|nr:hypothetical protein [Acidobacteriota bacterium]
MRTFVILWAALMAGSCVCRGGETEALAISANIRAKHLPFGTVLDPVYASSTSTQIVGYTRCGDSALWTGAYLAAEAFRYKVTGSADALSNVKAALSGLKSLSDVTGDNRLSRCMVLASSPFAAAIQSEESRNSVQSAPPWIWIDNTSRDEYVGVFFGLVVAYDLVDDATVKSTISDLATRLTGFVATHQWSPNDSITNTFRIRPEELQMLLNVTRHVNPADTVSGPFFEVPQDAAVSVDVQSRSSYFKFNLDYISYYSLLRLDPASSYSSGYKIVRNYTAAHQNAFFDVIDRAINGPDAMRDAGIRSLLDQWLQRSNRDGYVDVTNTVKVCGASACDPVPLPKRPPTDFIWQRDPFQLLGGGSATIESAGIDYILPYWMARYYGIYTAFTIQSAAANSMDVAAESIASIFGANLAAQTAQAMSQPLPLTLGGITLIVTDAAGTARTAPLMYVSPGQINFEVPPGTAKGPTTFAIVNGPATLSATGTVRTVAPTLFSMNGKGTGVAAATAIRTQAANPSLQSPVQVFQCGGSGCVSTPIDVGVDTPVYLTLYGTGIRNRSSLSNVKVTINGTSVPVLYAGPQPSFAGLDQVNVPLTLNLRGSGEANILLTVDGQTSNTVTVNIR